MGRGQGTGRGMANSMAWARAGLLLGAMAVAVPAAAQDRSGDNAITQAEDAFGFSVGREAIGIYGPGNARGFSPTAAGNVRIDGLYFDPSINLQNALVASTSIKVGLSAQGYPFVAPSGIVDHTLRRPETSPGGSIILSGDSWGGANIEVDASLPLSKTLAVRVGLSAGAVEFPNGTDNRNHSESLIVSWRPSPGIEIMPFWSRFHDYDDEIGTFYIPAGSYMPPVDRPRHLDGPEWADIRFNGDNAGVLASARLASNTVMRFGAFRSSTSFKANFNNLMVNVQPDGTGERLTIADPPTDNRSLSGELRLTQTFAEGPRLHVFHLSARRRDAKREFGGSDVVSFGIGRVGEKVTAPKPEFEFGALTRQHVQQMTYGLAYDGRWRDIGELSFSVARADYEKVTRIPEEAPVVARSRPWLYNGTVAVILSERVNAYAGYARGFEESGVAPSGAANRNEPLDAIITTQKDAGIKVALTSQLKAIVGLFDLTRPYFGFDTENVFRRLGSIRSRGLEFSLSGKPTARLNVLLGGVLLKPRVTPSEDSLAEIGSRPHGLPTHIINFNANWEASFADGLQLDLGMSHRGRQPATIDNRVFLDPRFQHECRDALRLQDRRTHFDPSPPGRQPARQQRPVRPGPGAVQFGRRKAGARLPHRRSLGPALCQEPASWKPARTWRLQYRHRHSWRARRAAHCRP